MKISLKRQLLPSVISIFFMYGALLAEEPRGSALPVAKSSGRTVAVVNNDPIFLSELEKESAPFVERFEKTTPESDKTPEKVSKLKKEILEELIKEKLLLQEAKIKKVRITKPEIERGIDQFKAPFREDALGKQRPETMVEREFQDQLLKEGMTQDQFNKRVEEQLMKVKLIEQEVKSKVALPQDEEVKKFFDKVEKKISGKPVETVSREEDDDLVRISTYLARLTGEQVRVRHIVVRAAKEDSALMKADAKKKIDEVALKLKNGEDFSFLAKKYTEDPVSKERGGDLGYVAKGDMRQMGMPELETAIAKLREGETSGIIQTDFGYHIMKTIERQAPHPLEYEEVAEMLKNYLAQKTFTVKLEKYLKDLRAKANVHINSAD